MNPLVILGATNKLTQPANWDESKLGKCMDLHCRISPNPQDPDSVWTESAWEPTAEELEHLNKGGSLVLRCYGYQPAVVLYVEPPLDLDDGVEIASMMESK